MKFANIQALRAVAVVLVLAAHVHDFSDRFNSHWALDWLSPIGTWGVDLFFVISGFIMVVVHYDDFAEQKSPQRFFLRRVIRIYPLYWLVTLVIVVMLHVPGVAHNWAGNRGSKLPRRYYSGRSPMGTSCLSLGRSRTKCTSIASLPCCCASLATWRCAPSSAGLALFSRCNSCRGAE